MLYTTQQRLSLRQRAGLIIINASAGGLYPMPQTPIYSTAKAGCVQLVRSLTQPLARKGIRIGAVCPEFTNTPLVTRILLGWTCSVMPAQSSV